MVVLMQFPILTLDAKGRVASVTTDPVGAAMTVTGDSGSEDINLLTESLSITGGSNLTSTDLLLMEYLLLSMRTFLLHLSGGAVITGVTTATGGLNASTINQSSTNAGITFGHEVLGGSALSLAL